MNAAKQKIKTIFSRRGRRVRREERNENEFADDFCHCILGILLFLCVLCVLERSGREKKSFVSGRGRRVKKGFRPQDSGS
jgi:hypothetical protein